MTDKKKKQNEEAIDGFPIPESNFVKIPNVFFDYLPRFTSQAEVVVVLYIIRHTWGYLEYGIPKKITLEEFEHGRKKADGTRMDKGVGVSRPSIINGLERAAEHGFIEVEIDDSDPARVKKFYSMKMSGVKDINSEVKESDSSGEKTLPRTEKETLEKNKKKDRKGLPPASLTIVAAEDDEPAAPKPVQEKPQRHASITDETLAKWVVVREWYAGQLAMGDQPAYRQCKLVAVVEGRAVVVAPNRLKADFWNNERVQTMLRKELKRQFGEAVTGVHHIVNGDPLPEEIAA